MTPHEKQAEQRARILGSYSNVEDCITKPEAVVEEPAATAEVIEPVVIDTPTGAEIVDQALAIVVPPVEEVKE